MGKILSIVLLLVVLVPASGQKDNSMRNMKNWQVKGLAKSAIRLGDPWQASIYLEELYRRKPSDEVGLMLGRNLMASRQYDKAERVYSELYKKAPRKSFEAQFYLAMLLKMDGNYEAALGHFEMTKSRHKRIADRNINRRRIENEIEGCRMALTYIDSIGREPDLEVKALSDGVNQGRMNHAPVIMGDTAFVYVSVHDEAPERIALGESYVAARKYYKATWRDGQWLSEPEYDVGSPFVNGDGYDSGKGAFSPDGRRFYFSRCFINPDGKRVCHIYVSRLGEDGWSEPQALDRNVNHPRYTSTQPTVGKLFDSNLEVLYFVSDRPGGAGGMDIWFAVCDIAKNEFQKPQNAGVFINTEGDELAPFYDIGTGRLFFSSNNLPGFGGYDIFSAEGSLVTWEPPVNLGLPINSPYDDLDYGLSPSAKLGLFVSNRPEEIAEGILPDRIFEVRMKAGISLHVGNDPSEQ